MSLETIKDFLSYDQFSGEFRWVARRGNIQAGTLAGCVTKKGYVVIKFNRLHYAHRLAWLFVYGRMPKMLDHINGNRADNRIANLRLANHQQNMANSRRRRSGSKSGFRGVEIRSGIKRYRAYICIDYKKVRLGDFVSADDAARAYDTAALRHFGKFARTNL